MSCRVVSKKSLPRGARRKFLENLAPVIFVKWCEGSQMASHVIVLLFFISFIHWMTEIKVFRRWQTRQCPIPSASTCAFPRVPVRVLAKHTSSELGAMRFFSHCFSTAAVPLRMAAAIALGKAAGYHSSSLCSPEEDKDEFMKILTASGLRTITGTRTL